MPSWFGQGQIYIFLPLLIFYLRVPFLSPGGGMWVCGLDWAGPGQG